MRPSPPCHAAASRHAVALREGWLAKADLSRRSWAKADPPDNRQPITNNRAVAGVGPVVSSQWSRSPSHGFTLVEMTVVILIIAILAGLIMTAASSMIDRARKTQAKNDVTQIVTAVNAFYTEYGRYPVLSTIGANGTYDGTNNDHLFNVLRGTASSGEDLSFNPRKIAFISPPVSKSATSPRGGLGQSDGKYYDPWGTAYFIRLDTTYSNWITTNPPYTNAPSWGGVNTGALAWSYGKDKTLGASGNGDATVNGFDDVLSWQ